jgi:hypothetical protein
MAETTSTSTKRAAKKPAAKRKPAARRTAAAKAKAPATGRRARTQAVNETREAAEANVRAARETAEQGKSMVERAALSYVGLTLEVRDGVIGAATTVTGTLGSRAKAGRELKKLQSRAERRGLSARNQLERDVKKARTRVERTIRRNREVVERDAARRPNPVTGQIAGVSGRVEDIAQVGVATAQRVGSIAKERIAAIA